MHPLPAFHFMSMPPPIPIHFKNGNGDDGVHIDFFKTDMTTILASCRSVMQRMEISLGP